ncbi:uncharacterized protein [Rutidosis leptorrhynchoides]|uniref:uncharacterized protein n=1 Tax=Rutidosis leptorrhynchoides TaxID=125765 RepID=UPI003A9985AB
MSTRNRQRKRKRNGDASAQPTANPGFDFTTPKLTPRQIACRYKLQRRNRLGSSSVSQVSLCSSNSCVPSGGLNIKPESVYVVGASSTSNLLCQSSYSQQLMDTVANTVNTGKRLVSNIVDVVASTSLATKLAISEGVTSFYRDLGDCNCVCSYCLATFWYDERLKTDRKLRYSKCCKDGRVSLPRDKEPPTLFKELLSSKHFMENIRAYNQMFSMTSYGARVDESINKNRGPYVFKISGQVYHWVGSLYPPEGCPPRFLQLYIYDTHNELDNRMAHFGGRDSSALCSEVVSRMIRTLDEHNKLIQLFRTVRDKCVASDIPPFEIRLYNVIGNKQYELPVSDSLGAIVHDDSQKNGGDYDLIIRSRDGTPQRVNRLHPLYMSLQFPLLFLHGQHGFHLGIKLRATRGCQCGKPRRMTMNMYYNYQLRDRFGLYNSLTRSGRLFQQYIVTAYCSIEQDRMEYIRINQHDIRNEYLSGLYDAINRGDYTGSDVGTRTILPASFTGSPRYMYSHYLDALAICRTHGNPQFFITFTCNVKWPEIRRYLLDYPHVNPSDRADIIARVFQLKVKQFITFLKEEKPFGHVAAELYTIEFQKCGLPHCHTLLWVRSPSGGFTVDDVDTYISAELPDPIFDPIGYKVVSELMMHGPCGPLKQDAPCMQSHTCLKRFPKPYNDNTFFDKDGYIHYRRRNSGVHILKGDDELDNTYVVPYNRLLCLTFHAHINVEYCGWKMLIKYLFKYISKGTDRITMHISRPLGESSEVASQSATKVDEIQNFINGRFICAHEASWRIFGFPIHHREPAVQILAVHLDGQQLLNFHAQQPLHSIVNDIEKKKTTLTEWLTFNRNCSDGHHLTYLEFPSEFVWNVTAKGWARRRKLNKPAIGRLSYMHPAVGEVFYLRMLLCHQKGCQTFDDIRTVDGIIHLTYRSACETLGLLGDDKEWTTTLEEASVSASSSQLRSLFAHILLFCEVVNPMKLWSENWKIMADDIPYMNTPGLEQHVLYEVEFILNQSSRSITDFGFPPLSENLSCDLRNRLIMEEKNYDRDVMATDYEMLISQLNTKQKIIHDLVVNALANNNQELLFVYGHGGTGKTFVWKTIISYMRAKGNIVLAVASSGIASLLLPSGSTAHSRFKLPINLTDESMCNIRKNTQLASLLKETHLIIWDEAPMNNRQCFETLDRTLKDILDNNSSLFGGKSVILGGDFRQTLPVKKKGSKLDIIDASIISSYLWEHFKVITLTENLRLMQKNLPEEEKKEVESFSSWLLKIGNGTIGVPDNEDPINSAWITIPEKYCIPDDENGLENLIRFIYDDQLLEYPTAVELQRKVIVCPKNDATDMINELILNKIHRKNKVYISSDSAKPYVNDGGESELLYPIEYLNTLNFPGLPPHKLELKVGVPAILLRNINLAGGLCNGTRMIITQLFTKSVEAEIITGTRVGQKVYIPRMCLIHKDTNLPFIFKRKQLPLKVSYAMTINKSQGQSLNKIGIYLPKPVFGHGQLYAALSRATTPNGLKILMKKHEEHEANVTKNIVYKDFLEKTTFTQDGATNINC